MAIKICPNRAALSPFRPMRMLWSTIFRAVLLLMLILLISPFNCQEPLSLGNGRGLKVLNLDMGAAKPGYKPFLGDTGFVAPPIPQTMVLSPGLMVHKPKILRDESASMMDESAVLLNETKTLADRVQTIANSTGGLAKQVRIDVEASSGYAAEAKGSLKEVKSIYNGTLSQVQFVSDLTKRNEALAAQAGISANDSAIHAAAAKRSLNETRSIYNQISLISQKIMSLTENNKTMIRQLSLPQTPLYQMRQLLSQLNETRSVRGLTLPWPRKAVHGRR